MLNVTTIELRSVDKAMVKTIESTLVKQRECLEKAQQDVVAYQAIVEYLEGVLVTPDLSKKLCWKDNLPKLSPWKLHKVLAKPRLLDPQLVEPQAQEDDNQSSPSGRVQE